MAPSTIKQRALEDARQAQAAAVALCRAASQPLPPYRLTELIGKGSFGRVYKAVATASGAGTSAGAVVAVKVIDIERGDAAAPGLADTLADVQAELRALRALRGARNVNHMLEALLVGPAAWVVVEYCAGGSVATLMRPARAAAAAAAAAADAAHGGAGAGLREKWIVPILRETAAALAWVHARGIIHRDVKAANVLVAEDGGGVQLCDFGVAATLRSAADRRTTVVGTPHAMAPELLAGGSCGGGASGAGYGAEVDVWAFGALAYELATGRPPNAELGVAAGLARLGRQLQMQTPRLVGDAHSDGIKDLVATCLRCEPARRPTMEEVRRHAYVAATEERYPTASLAQLVRAFRVWEAQGGDRRSLFAPGGAAPIYDGAEGDGIVQDWSFSTAVETDDDNVLDASDCEALSGAYGIEGQNGKEEGQEEEEEEEEEEGRSQRSATSRPQQQRRRRRRRRQPRHAATVKSPLEKVFDSNTLSNYDDYSRQYYAKFLPEPVQQALLHNGMAGLPQVADRESLIDLDLCLVGVGVSTGDSSSSSNSPFNSVDLGTDTVRPMAGYGLGDDTEEEEEEEEEEERCGGTKRATQDWKFPVMFPQLARDSDKEDRVSSSANWDDAASATSHSRSESAGSCLIDLDSAALPGTMLPRGQHDETQRSPEPPLPLAPLPQVMMGRAPDELVKHELRRMTASLADHLRYATAHLAGLADQPSICGSIGMTGSGDFKSAR
ncbi:hypothetical protein V2A60_010252 [Cordyceps javanica]